MFFPSSEEREYLRRGLGPQARQQPVLDELRGWSWDRPPLQPVSAETIAVADVAGEGCPTGRDLFLDRVEGYPPPVPPGHLDLDLVRGTLACAMAEARAAIYAVGERCVDALTAAIHDARQQAGRAPEVVDPDERTCQQLWAIRAFELQRVLHRVLEAQSLSGCLSPDALASLAVPVQLQVPVGGGFLGLEEPTYVDAVDLAEGIVYTLERAPVRSRCDLGIGLWRSERSPLVSAAGDFPGGRARLRTTGWALALERAYARPIDLGCVVYLAVEAGRVRVRRDYHLIGDELRQTFVEERDERVRVLEDTVDPGLPAQCPASCVYLARCHPRVEALPSAAECAPFANPSPGPNRAALATA